MPKTEVVLGLDTSCYTTSVAVMTLDGELVADKRQILTVRQGGRGLAQSEMVFQHTRNLPGLMERCKLSSYRIVAVAATAKPRPLEDSYMPAFLTGLGLARSIATALGVKLYTFTHQENHLAAALWSVGNLIKEAFLLLHASGGTTDVLLAEPVDGWYSLTPVGGGLDLQCGQFIDRVGVALGLSFPAGKELEKLAKESVHPCEIPVAVKGSNVSFAGPATAAQRLVGKALPSDIARGTEMTIATSFYRLLRNIALEHKVSKVLMVGGVSSNLYIRECVREKLKKHRITLLVPAPEYSSDNAVGSAFFGGLRTEG